MTNALRISTFAPLVPSGHSPRKQGEKKTQQQRDSCQSTNRRIAHSTGPRE
jgi:hypothetical protein